MYEYALEGGALEGGAQVCAHVRADVKRYMYMYVLSMWVGRDRKYSGGCDVYSSRGGWNTNIEQHSGLSSVHNKYGRDWA